MKTTVITTRMVIFSFIPFRQKFKTSSTARFFFLLFLTTESRSQWLSWENASTTRLTVTSVATSDGEEKDMWAADLNNDGREDLIVVRKTAFLQSYTTRKVDIVADEYQRYPDGSNNALCS